MAGVAQRMNIAISATGCLYLHFVNWIQLLQVLLSMEEINEVERTAAKAISSSVIVNRLQSPV